MKVLLLKPEFKNAHYGCRINRETTNSIKIYQTKLRSYKDLPLRFNDIDVIHRNEKSGQLNGLFRVRMFRQDDAHNFITQDQIGSEIKDIIEIAKYNYHFNDGEREDVARSITIKFANAFIIPAQTG